MPLPIAIVGGGVVGMSTALFLAQKLSAKRIVVFESDPKYIRASTPHAVGGVRSQFSTPTNCKLSMWTYDFLQNINSHLSVSADFSPDISFVKGAYLFLASSADQVAELEELTAMQRAAGANVDMLDAHKLGARFPWLNVSDLAAGAIGADREGWFCPSSLLQCLRRKVIQMGVQVLPLQVRGFGVGDAGSGLREVTSVTAILPTAPSSTRLDSAAATGDFGAMTIPVSAVVNAGGAWAADVAAMAGIGVPLSVAHTRMGSRARRDDCKSEIDEVGLPSAEAHCDSAHILDDDAPLCVRVPEEYAAAAAKDPRLACPVPIEPRRRNVFVVATQNPLATGDAVADIPLVVDPTGVYFRRESASTFVCGVSPPAERDPATSATVVENDMFDEELWPALAHRVPLFEAMRVKSAWAGTYEYNTLDRNAIIGRHPSMPNFLFAAGFSGHGLQHGPAVGNIMAEMLCEETPTINVEELGFERILAKKPIRESKVV